MLGDLVQLGPPHLGAGDAALRALSLDSNYSDYNDDNGDDDGDDGDDGNINAEQKEPATRTLGRGTLEDNPQGKLPPTWLGFCWD